MLLLAACRGAIIEARDAFEVHTDGVALRGIGFHSGIEVTEGDDIDDTFRSRAVLDVQTVAVPAVGREPAVVVNDAAIHLGLLCRLPEADAVARDIMDDEVDEFGIRPSHIKPVSERQISRIGASLLSHPLEVRTAHLKAPITSPGTVDRQNI